MKRITQRSIALVAVTAIAIATLAASASAAKSKSMSIYGRILQVDKQAQTVLVADRWTKKLYLVYMPEGATVTIVFGLDMRLSAPEFKNLRKNDIISARVYRGDSEHLARLEDGREAIVVSLAK